MTHTTYKQAVEELLKQADIQLNGSRPWDLNVKDEGFYRRAIQDGSIGIGESYMAGQWDAEAIDELALKIIEAKLPSKVKQNAKLAGQLAFAKIFSTATPKKAFEIGQQHYDIGNDLYQAMLDKRMVYTCAYWKDAKTLDEAQEAKLDLICRKVGLKPGMRILDIGGGWGSFAKYAAEKYGVSVVNVTVSKEQVALADELCKGLPVENRLQDYRDVNESFDAIVSIGMFEHVGVRHYRTYMEVVEKNLKEDGLFLLHTIGRNTSTGVGDPWITKYIFPNSMLPSVKQIAEAAEGLFILEDWHNFGPDYDKTLMAWFKNFDAHWPELKEKYGETFYRMWKLYLLSSAAAFRTRNIQLWQVVLSKRGVPGGYTSIR